MDSWPESFFYDPSDPGGVFEADEVWHSLDDRSKEVLRMRSLGCTLDQVAQAIGGVSRERARQIQVAAEEQFEGYLYAERPNLGSRLASLIGDRCAVADDELDGVVAATDPTARIVAMRTLGLSGVRIGTTILNGWWTSKPGTITQRLEKLIAQTPFLAKELADRAEALGLPPAITARFSDAHSSLLLVRNLGWVRRGRIGRDTAFLWLTMKGEPQTVRDIAAVVGSREHAIRENMRRDPDFTQIRPEGTWALTQWKSQVPATAYTNATEVVVDLLRERGPISLDTLFAAARELYPVGSWRYTQTLSDSRVGRTAAGLYDLTERGATPIEDVEPRRPENMVESDNRRIIAVRLPVNYDLLRGSGINVNRWLTWRLDLRVAPTLRRFELLDPPGEVTVRRNTSTASVSSLRVPVQELGLGDGCHVVLILRPESDTASLKHACAPASCPAESRTEEGSRPRSSGDHHHP